MGHHISILWYILKIKFILNKGVFNNNDKLSTLANNNLLEGESFPSLCSVVEQASIKVCAITDKHESTVVVLLMSKIKSGFFIKFTQNRKGRL